MPRGDRLNHYAIRAVILHNFKFLTSHGLLFNILVMCIKIYCNLQLLNDESAMAEIEEHAPSIGEDCVALSILHEVELLAALGANVNTMRRGANAHPELPAALRHLTRLVRSRNSTTVSADSGNNTSFILIKDLKPGTSAAVGIVLWNRTCSCRNGRRFLCCVASCKPHILQLKDLTEYIFTISSCKTEYHSLLPMVKFNFRFRNQIIQIR